MRALNYDLKNICLDWRVGSRATQAARFNILQLCADQLHELGYNLPSARSLKPKHVHALVGRWQGEGLGAGTLRNRLAMVRDWAERIGKASIMPADNAELGVGRPATFKGNRAFKLDRAKLEGIPDERVRMSLRLQAAFGLRREEALKFRPSIADKGDHIALQGTWCKGGRARSVPVLTDRQRALLDEARELAKGGSLIPEDCSYIQHRGRYQHACTRAGINNVHGLRHGYAQARYQALTGEKCPAAGGPVWSELSADRRQADLAARRTIAEELGHGRVSITDAYLGPRR